MQPGPLLSADARRLVQAEGGALVVAAQLEPSEPGGRLLVVAEIGTLKAAAQFTDLRHRGGHVVDPEEEVGPGPRVAAVDTPCPLGVPIA